MIAEAGVSRAAPASAENNPWIKLSEETSWRELSKESQTNRKDGAKQPSQATKESEATNYWQAVLELFEAVKARHYSDAIVSACRDPDNQSTIDEIMDPPEKHSLATSKFNHSYNRYRTACCRFKIKPAPAQFFLDATTDYRHLENEIKAVSYLCRGHKGIFPAEEIDQRCLRKLGKTQKSS